MKPKELIEGYERQISKLRARIEQDDLILHASAIADVLKDRAVACSTQTTALAVTLRTGAAAIDSLIERDAQWKAMLLRQLEIISTTLKAVNNPT